LAACTPRSSKSEPETTSPEPPPATAVIAPASQAGVYMFASDTLNAEP
jgi:hypothetical protein